MTSHHMFYYLYFSFFFIFGFTSMLYTTNSINRSNQLHQTNPMFPNSISSSVYNPTSISSTALCLAAESRPPSSNVLASEAAGREIDIRVCTNRTCRKQGSLETFQILSGITPPFVSVNRCGCLGRCGAGPNVLVLPDEVLVGHCATPFKAAHLILSITCGGDGGGDELQGRIRKCLDALAFRKRAEDLMSKGDFDAAQNLLSQAIDLKPCGGSHISYKSRSAARLAVGNIKGALEDANEALKLAPKCHEAHLCQGDALLALNQIDDAENSYLMALHLDPSLRRSKSFKAQIAKLEERRAI